MGMIAIAILCLESKTMQHFDSRDVPFGDFANVDQNLSKAKV